ncbi:MAG TPA: DNA polymerase III subunit delta [bacterium]
MKIDDFLNDARNGRVKQAYLLMGEPFIIEKNTESFIQLIFPDGKKDNLFFFNAEDVDMTELILNAKNLSFLGGKKVLVLKRAENLAAEMNEKLIEYLKNPSESSCLIILADSGFKNKKIHELINQKFGSVIQFLSYEKVSDKEQFIAEEFVSEGIIVDQNALKMLVELAGDTMSHLGDEIEKLKLLSKDRKRISLEDVENSVFAETQEDFYGLLNGIANRDPSLAMESFRSMIKKDYDFLPMLGAMATYIYSLFIVKCLMDRGMTPQEIEKETGEKSYPVRRKMEGCMNYSTDELLDALKKLLKIDLASKSSSVPKMVLFDEFFLSLGKKKRVRT